MRIQKTLKPQFYDMNTAGWDSNTCHSKSRPFENCDSLHLNTSITNKDVKTYITEMPPIDCNAREFMRISVQ